LIAPLTQPTVWDVGGRDKIRPLWRHYYQNTQGLIFVVDSNDRERISEAAEELYKMLREDELCDVALLVFANKQDLPNAMSCQEIADQMNLKAITHPWLIAGSSATSGDGLYEALDWLSHTIDKKMAGAHVTEALVGLPLEPTALADEDRASSSAAATAATTSGGGSDTSSKRGGFMSWLTGGDLTTSATSTCLSP